MYLDSWDPLVSNAFIGAKVYSVVSGRRRFNDAAEETFKVEFKVQI